MLKIEKMTDAEVSIELARMANATVIARTPAPPVSTSVPSMSKRMSMAAIDSNYPSLRTFPARGPLADGSSSKLTRWALPTPSWITVALRNATLQ